MNHQVPSGPHHWGGYGTTPDNSAANRQWHSSNQTNIRGIKRTISESDDCDDVYSEESSKDP